ncbi:hypothetical protein EHS13_02170 [Paenibacillus psychroresistens]|uniref:DUF559 domain-containing protein n=1 Tax=Paenibacillus psychroresistens TaxID=1778678 RepID=A0A6B8RE51_9BACL|nr:hypothetical protein [Paenibacillus psychroresistens]QGQ93793.1 hypothetical protein EHS13_02170 [Paenibacillus psychroresistens]
MPNKKTMELMWDVDKNFQTSGKNFNDVNCKDTFDAHWVCFFENRGCSFVKSPKQVYQAIYHGSPICNFCNEIPFEKSIAFSSPENVNYYWDYNKNELHNIFPEYLKSQSNVRIFVRCEKHKWEAQRSCADLNYHIPCPYCSKRMASPEYNLKVCFPDIANELHPKHNSVLILPFSTCIVEWWCKYCRGYYEKAVGLRTSQGHGCPLHKSAHQSSKTEGIILLVLNKLLGGFSKIKFKTVRWSNGRRIEIDIFNSKLKVALEYDGYPHKRNSIMISDQKKNEILHSFDEISVLIRIREEGLPPLKYNNNQFEIICAKHDQTYLFLIPAIQRVLQLIKDLNLISVQVYSDIYLISILEEIFPQVYSNAVFVLEKNSFTVSAPGLLGHLDDNNLNPSLVSRGSNHIFNVSCPNCKYKFPENQSSAKNLIRSKGRCPKCMFYVEDIQDKESLPKRKYSKISYKKSLEANEPEISKFYSSKNTRLPNQISHKGSTFLYIWNCPYCLKDYESNNRNQVNNGCKCIHCYKKAIDFEDTQINLTNR